MVTIKDIALQLNLAPSTVGRALADDSRISEPTKARVRLAAEKAGYVSNKAAKMMRGISSNLVGLIVPDISNSLFSTIARSLSQCLLSADYQLTLCETNDDPVLERRHIYELLSANVAGIIVVPTAKPMRESVALLGNVPHIQILRHQPELGQQWFGIDEEKATHEATSHLLALGHRHVAFIGGTEALATGRLRLKGYRRAVAEAGAVSSERLGSPASADFARLALRDLWAQKKPPTGVVTGAILHSQGVLDEVMSLGIRVPEEMSIVGFGDEPGFRWWGSGLTTMKTPMAELATACGLWFLHQLRAGKGAPREPYASISPATLVVRGSTAAPKSTRLR